MNFFDIAVFSTGIVCGIYLDQTYRLPNMKIIFNNAWKYLKQYEPLRKGREGMDLD